LGSEALDEYCRALADGANPQAAFAALVGQSPADYEKEFLAYLQRLQPDGTLANPSEK
jgi:hypothetical protein